MDIKRFGSCLSLYVDGSSLLISGNSSYMRGFGRGFVLLMSRNCSLCSSVSSVIKALIATSNSSFARFCKAVDLC
jgi:hypothetical protein